MRRPRPVAVSPTPLRENSFRLVACIGARPVRNSIFGCRAPGKRWSRRGLWRDIHLHSGVTSERSLFSGMTTLPQVGRWHFESTRADECRKAVRFCPGFSREQIFPVWDRSNGAIFALQRSAPMGLVLMGDSDEYRRYAAECLRIARASNDAQARGMLLQMAQVWLRLAKKRTSTCNVAKIENAFAADTRSE